MPNWRLLFECTSNIKMLSSTFLPRDNFRKPNNTYVYVYQCNTYIYMIDRSLKIWKAFVNIENKRRHGNLIIFSDFRVPRYQYNRGCSIDKVGIIKQNKDIQDGILHKQYNVASYLQKIRSRFMIIPPWLYALILYWCYHKYDNTKFWIIKLSPFNIHVWNLPGSIWKFAASLLCFLFAIQSYIRLQFTSLARDLITRHSKHVIVC